VHEYEKSDRFPFFSRPTLLYRRRGPGRSLLSVRYFEAAGAVRQALSVIKKRSGRHEKTIREFRLVSGHGLRIGQPLKQFQGILTGAPLFHGGAEQMMEQPNAGR
jgi:circadian clock protein KaiC